MDQIGPKINIAHRVAKPISLAIGNSQAVTTSGRTSPTATYVTYIAFTFSDRREDCQRWSENVRASTMELCALCHNPNIVKSGDMVLSKHKFRVEINNALKQAAQGRQSINE